MVETRLRRGVITWAPDWNGIKVCSRCKNQGHFARACPTKNIVDRRDRDRGDRDRGDNDRRGDDRRRSRSRSRDQDGDGDGDGDNNNNNSNNNNDDDDDDDNNSDDDDNNNDDDDNNNDHDDHDDNDGNNYDNYDDNTGDSDDGSEDGSEDDNNDDNNSDDNTDNGDNQNQRRVTRRVTNNNFRNRTDREGNRRRIPPQLLDRLIRDGEADRINADNNANLIAARALLGKRNSGGTKKIYTSKVKTFLKWLWSSRPESFNPNPSEHNFDEGLEYEVSFPINAQVVIEFFGWVSKQGRTVIVDATLSSEQSMQGYKSAIKDWLKMKGIYSSHYITSKTNNFFTFTLGQPDMPGDMIIKEMISGLKVATTTTTTTTTTITITTTTTTTSEP